MAFYVKYIKSNAVFIAALLAEACVIYIHVLNAYDIAPTFLKMSYLWYNVVGCVLVILFGLIIELLAHKKATTA